MIIAIDGPAASGKSTVAKEVARRLGYCFISTGAMYRAVTYKALQDKLDIYDEKAPALFVKKLKISFSLPTKQEERVLVDSEDVTEKLHNRRVDSSVSFIARVPGVRRELVKLQRELAKKGDVVMEGRDIGTVVLPNADVKFFLTASTTERARRRKLELEEQGHVCNVETLKREIINRDSLDSNRAVSPLIKDCEAFLIDTTGKTITQVIDFVLDIIDKTRK